MSAALVKYYEAAIIGGGPAGLSAAITLAKAGVQVVLIEAHPYPHHKVCGEVLSPECITVLHELDALTPLRACQPVTLETVRLTAPDGTAWENRFPMPALGLSRSTLDHTLAIRARQAGVEVREEETVGGINGELAHGFVLDTRTSQGRSQIRARTVISAHGKRGTLDRVLKRPFVDKRQPFLALKGHFRGPPIPRRVDLHGFPGGYCGMSEIEGGIANVCLLAHQKAFTNHRKTGAFVRWMQMQNPALREWLSQAEPVFAEWMSIAQVPFGPKNPIERDVLMAGDAAGLIVPLAGDGIAMALHSGQIAGAYAASFLRRDRSASDLRHDYAETWQRTFRARLRLGWFLQVVMLRPRLLSVGLRVLNLIPALGNALVDGTRDIQLSRNG